MGPRLDEAVRRISGDLEAGEEVLAAVRGMPEGEVPRVVLGGAGAVVAGVLGFVTALGLGAEVGQTRREADAAAGLPSSAGREVLAVITDRRIRFWALGPTGKPKEALGSIPLEDITEVSPGRTKLFGVPMASLQVTTGDGGAAGIAAGKIHRAEAEALVGAFRRSAG